MQIPHGVLADLAFGSAGNPVHIKFSLDPANGYAILASAAVINETESLLDLRMTLWGVPADHSHDSERCGPPHRHHYRMRHRTRSHALPHCPLRVRHRPDDLRSTTSTPGSTRPLRPRDRLPACPAWPPNATGRASNPTSKSPDRPARPIAHRPRRPPQAPQNENPERARDAAAQRLRLTLPAGIRFSPSVADGLESCSPAEIGLGTNAAGHLPRRLPHRRSDLTDAPSARTPRGFHLPRRPARQSHGSLFALYLVVDDTEDRGVLLKLPGRSTSTPPTARSAPLSATYPSSPSTISTSASAAAPAPRCFSPAPCGTQTIGASASLRPARRPLDLTDTYTIDEGPTGAPCAPGTESPFAPQLAGWHAQPRRRRQHPLRLQALPQRRRTAAEPGSPSPCRPACSPRSPRSPSALRPRSPRSQPARVRAGDSSPLPAAPPPAASVRRRSPLAPVPTRSTWAARSISLAPTTARPSA